MSLLVKELSLGNMMATEKDVKKKDSYELMSLLIYEISGCKFCTAVMARSIVHARLCMSTLLLLTLSLKKMSEVLLMRLITFFAATGLIFTPINATALTIT